MMTNDGVIALLALLTSGGVGLLVYRVAMTMRKARDMPVPPAVREKSHAVANEATKLKAELRSLQKEDDPFEALVSRVRAARWKVEHDGRT